MLCRSLPEIIWYNSGIPVQTPQIKRHRLNFKGEWKCPDESRDESPDGKTSVPWFGSSDKWGTRCMFQFSPHHKNKIFILFLGGEVLWMCRTIAPSIKGLFCFSAQIKQNSMRTKYHFFCFYIIPIAYTLLCLFPVPLIATKIEQMCGMADNYTCEDERGWKIKGPCESPLWLIIACSLRTEPGPVRWHINTV